MEVTAKQLRVQPGKIMARAHSGQEITITYRGKPHVKIVPIVNKKKLETEGTGNELFGLWKNREGSESVEQTVRNMRKGRKW